jgi:diacylglycerol kinase (ATP)
MEKNTGLKRLFYASLYSWKGLQSAIRHEAAFRQECLLFIVAIIISFFLDVTGMERLAMLVSVVLILIVE